jgi:hypothetical protein
MQLQQLPAAPTISAPSEYATSGAARGGISASNFLGPTYANPYYQGIRSQAVLSNSVPGGFGTPLFGTTGGGAGGGNIGSATGAAGGAGGAGGRGGTALGGGRLGGTGTGQDPGGVIVPLPVQIAYPAVAQFQVPVVVPALQADLRGVIDRTTAIANPAGVQIVMDGRTVVLRGAVRDRDEARLAEGLVRLTPGVGVVRNELTYPGK